MTTNQIKEKSTYELKDLLITFKNHLNYYVDKTDASELSDSQFVYNSNMAQTYADYVQKISLELRERAK